MPRFQLTLAYDGTDFAGSQAQGFQRTVQGELERALAGFAAAPMRTTFAGRTDRGVHAAGQVAAISMPSERLSASELHCALNATLPRDLAIMRVEPRAESFHPRYDAAWREYRYWMAPGAISPMLRRFAWATRSTLDINAMAAAASLFAGTHDFASFASGGEGVPWSDRARRPKGTTRTMLRCGCRELAFGPGPTDREPLPVIEVRVAADGFLPRMVRNIVAALVEVGRGNHDPAWIETMLSAGDRRLGPTTVPPNGLTLWRIGYDDDTLDDT